MIFSYSKNRLHSPTRRRSTVVYVISGVSRLIDAWSFMARRTNTELNPHLDARNKRLDAFTLSGDTNKTPPTMPAVSPNNAEILEYAGIPPTMLFVGKRLYTAVRLRRVNPWCDVSRWLQDGVVPPLSAPLHCPFRSSESEESSPTQETERKI